VATGTPHLRERLCDLLWEGPDDPRAALRWSLTKLRPLLNDPAATRLLADRERVAFAPGHAAVDAVQVRQLLGGGPAATPPAALKSAVSLFRGEFLDGLELPSCYRFHAWCIGEREALSALRQEALAALVRRLEDAPEEALAYARLMVASDPLSEAGHAAVVRLLGRLGRVREAQDRYEYGRRVLEGELAAPLSGELERARGAVRAPDAPAPRRRRGEPPPAAGEAPAFPGPGVGPPEPLVGRRAERDRLGRLVAAAARHQAQQVLLISGEPGIGKSRLLAELREQVLRAGGRVLGGRAFEAELARPYGAWIDALRAVPAGDVPAGARHDLALLLPELGAPRTADGSRLRLFDAVVALLRHLAGERLLAVLFDDVHWLDDASASLLHYVARACAAPSALLLACAARRGELADSAALLRVTRSLERDRRLVDLELGPLDAGATAELVRATEPALDPAAAFAESGGNPLFILGLARARRRGDARGGGRGDGAPHQSLGGLSGLSELIDGHLARLDAGARDLLGWAAALGRRFTPDTLAAAAGGGPHELLAALGHLERREILRPSGAAEYDFAHDLIRQAAYRSLSQPRRRLIHRQIARVLAAAADADPSLAGELARHAALAGDDALAARAACAAGERCLRLFANAEAAALAERGLGHLERTAPGPDRLRCHIALLQVKVLAAAGPGLRRLPRVAEELTRAVAAAEAAGLYAEAATGLYLLSVVHQEAGDPGSAARSTLDAAAAARDADRATRARQLANTARCLAELEREVARARALLRESEALAGPAGLELTELRWGLGLLRRWDGDLDAAADLVERALRLARRAEDRWRESRCLTWLAMIELERGRPEQTRARCRELTRVAAKMGDRDPPVAGALLALAQSPAGGPGAPARITRALARLREVDDKSHLAYALNAAGARHLAAGRAEAARVCAQEALTAAAAVRRRSETVIAESLLARLAVAAGDDRGPAQRVRDLLREADAPDALSARARAAVATAARAVGLPAPTLAPTAPADAHGDL
jgi:hypothetical protein